MFSTKILIFDYSVEKNMRAEIWAWRVALTVGQRSYTLFLTILSVFSTTHTIINFLQFVIETQLSCYKIDYINTQQVIVQSQCCIAVIIIYLQNIPSISRNAPQFLPVISFLTLLSCFIYFSVLGAERDLTAQASTPSHTHDLSSLISLVSFSNDLLLTIHVC